MTAMDLIRSRHSVREYTNAPIEGNAFQVLTDTIDKVRQESGLNIQFLQGNPEVFEVVAKFGLVHGCSNNIAFVSAGKDDDVAIGYWGQKIVLKAQELGLNTCWVAMCSRKKSKAILKEGERVRLVIAVGYGVDNGHERKTKSFNELCTVECETVPAWFKFAAEAAQLAPTAVNAQNFHITLLKDGKTVRIEARNSGWRQLDMGIVRCNFELAANEFGAVWRWE